LSIAVDDVVERRLRELDQHTADIDAAAATDAAGRACSAPRRVHPGVATRGSASVCGTT
jgi:hypothetical protein